MANYSAIKAAVNGYIKRNGRKEITGNILNAVLNATIDSLGRYYQFAGGAMPTDDPGTPDQNVCYLAGEPGLYINFGNIRVTNEEVALLFWDGEWKKQSVLYGIQEVDAHVDPHVGTPSVDVSYSQGRLVLTFHNIKGEKGDTGDPAGFGTIGADITGGVGNPGVSVDYSGNNSAKNLMFHFTNLKGEAGVTSVVATIDETSGTPSCQVSLVNGQLTLAFSGLKGLKGDTGVSADYPITIYNGLDSDATDQALAAAQGKVLDGKIANLKREQDDFVTDRLRNFTPGYAANNDATIVPISGFAVTDYFPISAGDTIKWNYMGAADTQNVLITLYEEDGTYVTYYSANVANSRTLTVSSSSTAKKARATIYFDDVTGRCADGASVLVNDVLVWSPVYPNDAEFSHVVKTKDQLLPGNEKEQARINIDLPAMFTGQKANYVSGGYISTGGRAISMPGWNITDYIPYTPGSGVIVWRMGLGATDASYKPALVLFDSNKQYLNLYSSNGYANERTIDNISVAGTAFIRVSFYQDYRGQKNLIPVTIGGVDYVIKDEVKALGETYESKRWRPFPLGTLVQMDISGTSGDLVDDTFTYKRVSMKSKVVVPFEGVKMRFFSPLDSPYEMTMGVICLDSRGTNGQTIDFKGLSGEEKSLPLNAKSLRIMFRKRLRYDANGSNNWEDLSVADVNAMISAGTLRVEYFDATPENTSERNECIQAKVSASRRILNLVTNADNGMDKLAVFAHISDLHGDVVRLSNCAEYCEIDGGIDAILNSGDSSLYAHPDASTFVDDISAKISTPMLFCIGNHESYPTGQSTLFADNISGLVTKNGYLKSPGTPTDHCYYYRDFASKKIRVITLNYYEDGVYNGRLGQNQIDWFIGVLASTPSGYGVIVMLHSPEDHVIAPDGVDKFMQPSPKYGDNYQPGGFYVDTRPIMQIVDAFIGKTTLNTTYTDHSSTYNGNDDLTTESVTINADFTGVDASTEFIAYVCGHRHEDNTGYYEHSTHRQLCLGIVCGIALFGDSSNSAWTNQCDLPRGGTGVQQDAFNIFAIDRDGGNVRMVRIGANVTIRFADRDMMIIPYREE